MGNCQCFARPQEEKTELSLNKKKPDPKLYLKNILKIQSVIRGHLARKAFFGMRLQGYNQRVIDNLLKYAYNYHLKQNKKMPAFQYNYLEDNTDPLFQERQFRPVTHIANGGIYKGEW